MVLCMLVYDEVWNKMGFVSWIQGPWNMDSLKGLNWCVLG